MRTFVATYRNGSQDLVTIYDDGYATIAARRNEQATWGIPTELREAVYA